MMHSQRTRWSTCLTAQFVGRGLLLLLICGIASGCGINQSTSSGAPQSEKSDVSEARRDFEEVFREWTEMLNELHELEMAFHTASADERKKLFEQHVEKLNEGYAMEKRLLSAAQRAYSTHPHKNEDLKEFLLQIAAMLVQAECYEDGLRVSQMLLDGELDELDVYRMAGEAAFACSEFDVAEQCLRVVQRRQGGSEEVAQRLSLIEVYQEEWKREQELREEEQLANNLPRVVLVTTRGEIELELFEDQAPNTVANFIKLVENGFYDGSSFHEVKAQFGATAGCPVGDGSGSPGHFIRHEFDNPERRLHYRGSICTVSEGPVANGSQFRITFLPTPELEGKSTVFGRVVRGLEILARLQRRSTEGLSSSTTPPDQIVTAKVLRNRDHPYKPDRIPDPSAEQRNKQSKYMQKMLSR